LKKHEFIKTLATIAVVACLALFGGFAMGSFVADLLPEPAAEVTKHIPLTGEQKRYIDLEKAPSLPMTLSERALKTAVRMIIPYELGQGNVVTKAVRGSAIHMRNNIFLSARHVCEALKHAKQQPYVIDYKRNMFPIIRYESSVFPIDVCIFKINAPIPSLWPETQMEQNRVDLVGQIIINGSFSGGEYYSYRVGRIITDEVIDTGSIRGYEDTALTVNIFTAELDIRPGASGSGALNLDGKLVGIVVLSYPPYAGITRLEDVKAFLRKSKIAKEELYGN
jgi:hypothetical protein